MSRYVSMLNLDECKEVFNYWIMDKLKATSELVITSVVGDKAKCKFKIKNEDCTAVIRTNYNEFGYCNAVLFAYHKGVAEPVSIKRAVDHAGGPSFETNEWMKLSYDRWKSLNGGNNQPKNRKIEKKEKTAADLLKEKEEEARLQFLADKADYLDRLPGAAVAQYLYRAAVSLQDPIHHSNQVVKTPQQHPYPIKKGFENPKDFLIMPTHTPNLKQILKFIKSGVFQMPSNPYGFTAEDVALRIEDPKTEFDLKNYTNDIDVSTGVGIMPSMGLDGVITNIQKYLVQPLQNGTDKIFAKQAIVRGSFYIFDHERKLNSDWQPKNILITEGWATAKPLDRLFNKHADETLVVVAWNAGQIKNAVRQCADFYPKSNLMIASDNDVKSFIHANEKDPSELHLVRNTGIQSAIDAYHSNPDLAHRLSIITPNINHETHLNSKCPSDFDDIESMYGHEAIKANVAQEIQAAVKRRAAGIPETNHLVDMYNQQVEFCSNHHNIPLHKITATGSLEAEPYVPAKLAQERQLAADNALKQEDDLINQMAAMPTADFFNVAVNDEIKSDFDKKMDESAKIINGAALAEPSASNVVTNTLAPTIDAPAEQPIVDPNAFTMVLYQSHLMNTFSKIQELDNKQEMLTALESDVVTMDSANKMIQAMFDPTISPHIPNMLDNVIENYKDLPIYEDLSQIKTILDEDYLKLNDESLQFIQNVQRDVVNSIVFNHQHQGLDDEIAQRVVSQEISQQPLELKKEFYRELRDTMRNLGESDEKWLQSVKDVLIESKQAATAMSAQPVNEKSATAEYSPS